jgi:hypothetical protein
VHECYSDDALPASILGQLEIVGHEIENWIPFVIDNGDVNDDAGGNRFNGWLLPADQTTQEGGEGDGECRASHGHLACELLA